MMSKGYLLSTLENNCFYVRAEICIHGKTIKIGSRLIQDAAIRQFPIEFYIMYPMIHHCIINR